MPYSLEEAVKELENNCVKQLTESNFLHPLSSSTIFPLSLEIISTQPKSSDTKMLNAVTEILQWGLLINQVYQRKLEMMFEEFKKDVPMTEDEYRGYSRDVQSFLDLRKRFSPRINSRFTKLKTVPSLRDRNFLPDYPDAKDFAFQLIELSEAYDNFAITPCKHEREEERGERYEKLESYNIYQTLISYYSPLSDYCCIPNTKVKSQLLYFMTRNIRNKPQELSDNFTTAFQHLSQKEDCLLDYENRNYLYLLSYLKRIDLTGAGNIDLARDTISALRAVVDIGRRESKQCRNNCTAQKLSTYFSELEKIIAPTNLHIGFNKNRKDDWDNRLNICLSKGNKWGGFSLLYSLDPHTKLLFFTADNDDEAQAEAIFFEAEDEKGKSYLVLEGLVLNKEFTTKIALRQDRYPHLMSHLFSPHLPQSALDLALYHIFLYAQERQKDLFINMKEVTSTKEYGPHEMLSYLSEMFLTAKYRFVVDDAPDRKRKFVYGEGGQQLYLRKNNQDLFQKLQEMGISVPPELMSNGKLLFYNHTWGNPHDPDSWINICEGEVRGIVITLEEISQFLKRS